MLFRPERVAEKCLDNPVLANELRLNLPEKRAKTARKRWTKQLAEAGAPDLADALLATLDDDASFDQLVKEFTAGHRDNAPLALPLWPERVIGACLQEVAMAEGHALRRFFWYNAVDEGWRRRVEPRQEIRREVERRQGMR